jgi:hypothetical protein
MATIKIEASATVTISVHDEELATLLPKLAQREQPFRYFVSGKHAPSEHRVILDLEGPWASVSAVVGWLTSELSA